MMMKRFVKSIRDGNLIEAERLFHARIEVIAEKKMCEKKKMIMAKESVISSTFDPVASILKRITKEK